MEGFLSKSRHSNVAFRFQDWTWSKEEHIEQIETENKFVSDVFNHLQENNGKLAIENEDIKKNLALAEERQKCYSTSGALRRRSSPNSWS